MHSDANFRDLTVEQETRRRQGIAAARTMHGHAIAGKGSSEFRTFTTWATMRQRCGNPKDSSYHRYGGRGIKVCPQWFEYVQFLADVGLAPVGKSIDRINNDGDYEPGNVRWATKQEQARNRRSNHLIRILGEQRTLAEWAEFSGLSSSTIRMRIKYNGGVVDESTILLPVTQGKSVVEKHTRLEKQAADMRAKYSKSVEVTTGV